eukprot:CAMPEP_0174372944 /NCGR_PEP_ID=MMETSP0811_2-20130205/105259_1 /TAXON_ID=73025 ORGANISM="Eutreptiella gymnastica-like, Strain CCMP1594" /NCGR_SAMPLE_ID=MMETSP0811_2 /ASSEMBLY_ACC=CAM_ASM_000667 /LENGTH=54 /DNA_ID=CAMNT_0015520787 /DNA_START=38 /DNA_END=202 /DNA_ORIENTATION=+
MPPVPVQGGLYDAAPKIIASSCPGKRRKGRKDWEAEHVGLKTKKKLGHPRDTHA